MVDFEVVMIVGFERFFFPLVRVFLLNFGFFVVFEVSIFFYFSGFLLSIFCF